MKDVQYQKVFWGKNDPWKRKEPTQEEKILHIEEIWKNFVGNEKAIKKLKAVIFDALKNEYHLARELAFAIFGPSSAGKTTLARLFAKSLELPFVEISSPNLKNTDILLENIKIELKDHKIPLVGKILPPMVIFLDEVHALPRITVQDLLKSIEYTDKPKIRDVDCYNVTWIIATTDEGKLFDAFRTRFTPINLKYLNKHDIAKIVKLNNYDFPVEIAQLVAHYNTRIPRKALEFARYMRLVKQMLPEKSWEEVAHEVAEDEGIDKFGMNNQYLRVLRALEVAPVAKNRIIHIVGAKLEEVERYIMPWLLTETDDQPPLVQVTSRGYSITEAGKKELEKRK